MSTDPYSDGGEHYGGEDFVDEAGLGGGDEAEMHDLVAEHVALQLQQREAAEALIATDPTLGDPEEAEEF